ncbi:MAG: outer membrane beta-barrel protein [Alphaproteobacteria bacterium]|nr:outer membrane beta-barrel protein [Alphaproteobacteria bacterium]
MSKGILKFALLLATAQLALAAPALAQDADSSGDGWLVRVRGIGVLPGDDGTTSISGHPEADNAVVPELDISYFFTKNIAAELILATTSHDVKAIGTTLGDLDVGETMLLPPVLTLQYHFSPDQAFSPYVGAGINYTMTYSEDDGNDTTAFKLDNGLGWALQAGADYWVDQNWGLNLDVKKVWVDVDASINNGAITANAELDPWIVGAGVSYRF